jgi:hypothetical protein
MQELFPFTLAEVAQLVSVPHHFFAEVAQLVEQRFCKPSVAGSSPAFGSSKTYEVIYGLCFRPVVRDKP